MTPRSAHPRVPGRSAIAALGGSRARPRLRRLVRHVRCAGPRPHRHGLERRGDALVACPGSASGARAAVRAGRAARRWGLLRRNLGLITVYGVLAVAGAQFCYFSAVQHMQVGPAILIEFTAPAAVVVWMWLRHGQRPGG